MAMFSRFLLSATEIAPPLPCALKQGEAATLRFQGAALLEAWAREGGASARDTAAQGFTAQGFTAQVQSPAPTHMPLAQCRCKLRVRGDVQLHPAWLYEGGLPYLYRDIDDALTPDTHHARYALTITAHGEDWPRRAYYKVQCPPRINAQYAVPPGGGAWRFTCLVKTQALSVQPHGCAEICFERFRKRGGVDVRDISGTPDETLRVPLPQGDTGGWAPLACDIPLDDDIAAILVTIAVQHATGSVWLEEPCLANAHGFNVLPPFDETNRYHENFNWFGENLSQKEWTDVAVTVNGTPLPVQPLFQRCFRGSENEIELPRGLLHDGENEITLRNVCAYRAPLPWQLQQAELLVEETPPVRIAWAPRTVTPGETFGVLLKTYADDTLVSVHAENGLAAPQTLRCARAGLHALRVTAPKNGCALRFSVSAGGYTAHGCIGRVVQRGDDGVLTGSGDAIYVPQSIPELEDFLVWYLENELGSFLTFRPVYRWSGTRSCNEALWHRVKDLCEGLNLHYCVILDGRELPGMNANPTAALLDGPYYLGHQAHERDGALYYWQQRKHPTNDVLYEELCAHAFSHPDFLRAQPIEYEGERVNFCFSSTAPRDMQQAKEQFVQRARALLKGVARHTGPSMLYKYLFEAGLSVGGAELLYGPQEIACAALRGASIAYGRPRMAAHLAVQWSTTPHDTEQRYRRYQLALFISYLQGMHHINTEEGLYRMEELFAVLDRFSEPCLRHAQVQRDFARFVQTHTRRGKLARGVAFLHGANDGWTCFCRRNVWAQEGASWQFGPPEESWDLLTVFYPDSVLNAIYRHPCPNEPQGYFTRTPYGTVDILPVEAGVQTLQTYTHLAFVGWNTADAQQVQRLTDFVRQGGKLLLGAPQLFCETKRSRALGKTPRMADMRGLCGAEIDGFFQTGAARGQGNITLYGAQAVQRRGGQPLLLRHRLGKGEVWFVNARQYAAQPEVRAVYETVLQRFAHESLAWQAQTGCLRADGCVQSTIYDAPDGTRTLYAVNTCWYDDARESEPATLCIGGAEYGTDIHRGVINVFTLCGDIAVQTADVETEVLTLHADADGGIAITVQGQGNARLWVFAHGKQQCVTAALCGVTMISLKGETVTCIPPSH